ncbi:MAG: hypothetical protein AB7J40_06335 [Candidatus Altimarinota bacterium]
MKINDQHHKRILLVLTAVLVFWLGRLSIHYEVHRELPPVQTVPEINEKIPMIEILDISNGQITGAVNKSEIRIKSGDSVAVPDENNQFILSIQHLGFLGERVPIVKHQIPEWAQFVASKNGKYFYGLDESSAKNLSVENRVYFANQQDAENSGYQKRTR